MPSLEAFNKVFCDTLQSQWNETNLVNQSATSLRQLLSSLYRIPAEPDILGAFGSLDPRSAYAHVVGRDATPTCEIDFDGSVCWNETTAATTAIELCPFTICDGCDSPDIYVTRVCSPGGKWASKNDWSGCLRLLKTRPDCYSLGCHECPDVFKDLVIATSLFLSIISILLLLISLVLFLSFRSLRCRRLTIHINLASSFILRFFFLTIWTTSQIRHAFFDCDSKQHKRNNLLHMEPFCKALLWLVIYTQVTSIMWMFVEGTYLISRFTVLALRRSEGPIWIYLAVGWVLPIFPTVVWAILHDLNGDPDSFCWMPYTKGDELWILVSVMGTAITLNLIFLLVIVGMLIQKLKAANSDESQKIWKTAKATLLLVPLLGISNVPLLWEPRKPSGFYMYISTVLQNSQGIFIAILYCFCNIEVRNAVSRHVRNWRMKRRATETDVPASARNSILPRLSIVSKRNSVQIPAQETSHYTRINAGSNSTPHTPNTSKRRLRRSRKENRAHKDKTADGSVTTSLVDHATDNGSKASYLRPPEYNDVNLREEAEYAKLHGVDDVADGYSTHLEVTYSNC